MVVLGQQFGQQRLQHQTFLGKTRVEIENRSQVTVRVYRTENPDEIISIPYTSARVIREKTNVPERTCLDFCWMPPEEFPDERADDNKGAGVHPILLREDEI